MICSQCRVWPLVADDNFCSWCGASYLRYSARLEPRPTVRGEYAPPARLTVSNDSATQEIVVVRVLADAPWVQALATDDLPARLRPGEQRRILLDVDIFAADAGDRATIRVEVEHAEARLVTLVLSGEECRQGASGR